ncbi:MAG: DUF2470 domain-containing protein, partial [Alphaproteobacteria bacterium]|nr:DUF2470 domain-containing protein [Alphaproteobacteria bacterium]
RNPLAHPRYSLVGEIEYPDAEEADQLLNRFINRHADAAIYASFSDFKIVRLRPKRVHQVAGFGKIQWINWSDIGLAPESYADLVASETDIIDHMNSDHCDVVNLIATKLCASSPALTVGWKLTGIDPDGCDLQLEGQALRYSFDSLVYTANDVRKAFVEAAKVARRTI